ncbi:G-type lectin S-receptor-like serine/threonine-protein kinase At1g11410 [Impatiens glandulifera]|uniref:G-type lectin S-receptor-like serine/threonine-protein kinase At1g11410 n=1 Tax=Impatiens glandulifera TaxID=253017 RepID=UPI001FB08147|nr:G-type lectin S-receptor-like serine/threonine-protein kinase At1g11410 [Impatiens glandulifera]
MGLSVLVLIILSLIFQQFCCNSLDTITVGNPLKDDGSSIVSNGGIFGLGFFSPGKSSTNRYVGIWYLFSNQTVVWVANRDNPLRDSSGVLSFDDKGNLIILSSSSGGSNVPVWSTNVSGSSGNQFSGQLLDTGNLKLIHDDAVVWQSFDYPTNTWLPLMKLGLDRKTGLNRFLTSWKSEDDPGTGEFSYQMDLITALPEMIFQQGNTNRIWRTGPWIGRGWVGIPQMTRTDFIFTTNLINSEDEVSVTYIMSNDSIFTSVVANESGILERLTWKVSDRQWHAFWTSNTEECDQYNHCGTFGNCDPQNADPNFLCSCLPGFEPNSTIDWNTIRDGSGGCVRKKGQPICEKGDGFVKVVQAKSPYTRVARLNKNMGVEECREECLNNCTCTAYASAGDPVQCITWHGELLDTRVLQGGGQDLYVRVNAIELAQYLKSQRSPKARRKRVVHIIVASTTSMTLAIGVALTIYWFVTVKKKKDRKTRERLMMLTPADGSSVEPSKTGKSFDHVIFFDLSTIVAATNNFSISNKLGQGGFGPVYKGRLSDGMEIAVKRLAKSSKQGIEEFKNEVSLIAKLQHRNLVKLLGCCVEHHEKVLIYEFLPNKSLDSFIFDKDKCSQLNWEKRFNIILGIAKGMLYLHQDSRLKIIHRDLKVSNILLDDGLNPKISDFGMARIFKCGQTEANTRRIVGTYGYMSPEYAMRGLYSIRSDVFSFGVVMLEVISGRRNNSYYRENTINLIGHAWDLWKEGKALDIIDQSFVGELWPREEVLRCFQIGLLCVQKRVIDRPTMSDVVFMLCKEMTLPLPNQPAFIFIGQDMNDSDSSASNSNNGLTITQIIGQ